MKFLFASVIAPLVLAASAAAATLTYTADVNARNSFNTTFHAGTGTVAVSATLAARSNQRYFMLVDDAGGAEACEALVERASGDQTLSCQFEASDQDYTLFVIPGNKGSQTTRVTITVTGDVS